MKKSVLVVLAVTVFILAASIQARAESPEYMDLEFVPIEETEGTEPDFPLLTLNPDLVNEVSDFPKLKLADTDNDGVPNIVDNCPDIANPKEEIPLPDDQAGPPEMAQPDEDDDGIGDACDEDYVPPEDDGDDEYADDDDEDGGYIEDDEEGEELEDVELEEAAEMNFYDLNEEEFNDAMAANAEGAGCSMVPAASSSALMLLIISAAFVPVAIRRRK